MFFLYILIDGSILFNLLMHDRTHPLKMFARFFLPKLKLLTVFWRFLGQREQLLDILTHFIDFYAVLNLKFLELLKCVSRAYRK